MMKRIVMIVAVVWAVAQVSLAQTDTSLTAALSVDTLTQQQRIEQLEQQLAAMQKETDNTKRDLATDRKWSRKRFLNLSYGKQQTEPDYGGKFESSLSVDMMKGWDIYLHRRPLGNVLMLGIDLGVFMSGTKYKVEEGMFGSNAMFRDSDDEDGKPDFYQLDMGGFLGPAVTVNPVGQLKVKAWWYFVPALSIQFTKTGSGLDSLEQSQAFGSFTKYGVELSYGLLGIGLEVKSGKAKYKTVQYGFDSSEIDVKTQFDMSSTKFYVTLKI